MMNNLRNHHGCSLIVLLLWRAIFTTIITTTIITTTITTTHAQETLSFSCRWTQDTCPLVHNGQCDTNRAECGSETDCLDCDTFSTLNYNCDGCIAAGGYWCPGDARCQSTPLTNDYWDLYTPKIVSACTTTEDWQQTCETSADNVFNDPLYDSMKWMYQLINVEAVWQQGITGTGVHVRINDNGVDAQHAEWADRFDVEHSCTDNYLPPNLTSDFHGTAIASILAAGADNNECSVGIAPGATISACYVLGLDASAATLDHVLDWVDISSNSWGPFPCKYDWDPRGFDRHLNEQPQQKPQFTLHRQLQDGSTACVFAHRSTEADSPCQVCSGSGDATTTYDLSNNKACTSAIQRHCVLFYEYDADACEEYLDVFADCRFNSLDPDQQETFVRAITEGRNGKGVIFTFPAGNEREMGSNANLDGFVNSRYTIAVGAVDKQGNFASYSTPGSPVFVTAPGGDQEYLSGNIVAKPGGGCHDATVGTSFSTPVVSGVIALMLEVNPDLTWRDVQGVLAATAQQNDPESTSWYTNAAGFHHSYWYGFGLVDAAAAVALSANWTNFGPELEITVESGTIDLPLEDDSTQATTSTLTVSGDYSGIFTESVVVYLDLFHGSRGDLQIKLVSPSGTESILSPGKRPENLQLPDGDEWKLMTVRNWGESPVGDWTLSLVDEKRGIRSDCVDYPFEYRMDGEEDGTVYVIDCDVLENVTWCKDGSVFELTAAFLPDTENGNNLLAVQACCACGGGTYVADQPYVLKSWRMAVYGHSGDPSPALDATAAPAVERKNGTQDLLGDFIASARNDTVYSVDYRARFRRILDDGCERPPVDTLIIACDRGQLEILNVSHPSIACQDATIFETEGEYTACLLTCTGEECNNVFINDAIGEVEYRCSFQGDVNRIRSLFLLAGTDVSSMSGTCSEGNSGDGINLVMSELNVLCGESYVNDDNYVECGLGVGLSMDIDGAYTCVTGNVCPGESCVIEYATLSLTSDVHNFQECINTDDGSEAPKPDVPTGDVLPAGEYKATFLAGTGFYYNESNCEGSKNILRVECVNGTVELLSFNESMTCSAVGENEIECTENEDSPLNEMINALFYTCVSLDSIPQTRAQYFSTDVSCSTPAVVYRTVDLGFFCAEGDSNNTYWFPDHFVECNKENMGSDMDSRFGCVSQVGAPGDNTPTSIPTAEVYTDYRWSRLPVSSCYNYTPSAAASKINDYQYRAANLAKAHLSGHKL